MFEHGARGKHSRQSGQPAARVGAGARQKEVLDRGAVVRPAEQRPRDPGLIERVLAVKDVSARQTPALLEIFGLHGLAGESATSLPYGSQRRLEIARALATEPKLLLLDEPAAGMNPQESIALMDLIRWIRDEFHLTILLVEHNMKVVMGICEIVQVIDYGEVIATGTPAEIQRNQAVIDAYLGGG